jgi:hypothetical protein
VYRKIPEGEVEARIATAKSIVQNISDHCEKVESMAAAAANRDMREMFNNIDAYSLLDTLAIASENPEYLLWSDEALMQATVYFDFGRPSISSQHVIEQLRADGALSWVSTDECQAKLVGWHYRPAHYNASIAFAAARLSNWDPTLTPFKTFVDEFSRPHWSVQKKCDMALELFVKTFRSQAGGFGDTTIFLAVMNAIGAGRAASTIRGAAPAACMPDREVLQAIRIALKVWEEDWLGPY